MKHRISRRELWQAQGALLLAILLQYIASRTGGTLLPANHYSIILIELVLVAVLGFTVNRRKESFGPHHLFAVILLGLISVANISALILVLETLIRGGAAHGTELLATAVVIFLTNIIVYALWYWEIDSPGLTRTRWSKYDKDFQFVQYDHPQEHPRWQPEFIDYLFIAVTNAVNFAPADAAPLTRQVKLLMASQAMVSVFTLALLVARSVSILGL